MIYILLTVGFTALAVAAYAKASRMVRPAEPGLNHRIAEANAFLDSIIENIPNLVYVKDAAELRYVRVNRAGQELTGLSSAQLLGKSDLELFAPQLAKAYRDADLRALAGDGLVEVPEEAVETPTGMRWLHTKKLPILGSDGRPRFVLGISADITESKRLADRLREAKDDLELRVRERTADLIAANAELRRESQERAAATEALEHAQSQLRQSQKMEAIGQLAGGIAHDFNNLLSVIISYTDFLLENATDGAREDLEEVNRAGLRAADLTRQLLAFSRQQVMSPRTMDLNDILLGMDKMLRRMIGENIELRFSAGDDLPPVTVDVGQIEQVVMNLVVNARDAMPDGGMLTVETMTVDSDRIGHPELEPGRHVMLVVTDTGHGIDPQVQARVFEPFFTTKERGKGTGLGLSTVFGIVRQSGGAVRFQSELGVGTSFRVLLPVATAPAEELPPAAITSAHRGTETVLIVEDEDQVRRLARGILTRAGYRVLDANNGQAALALCTTFDGAIDLVLSDVVMPKMGGRELVERLAIIRPMTKILLMSGYADDTLVHHRIHQGIAFLPKPLTLQSLLRKVREILGQAPRKSAIVMAPVLDVPSGAERIQNDVVAKPRDSLSERRGGRS